MKCDVSHDVKLVTKLYSPIFPLKIRVSFCIFFSPTNFIDPGIKSLEPESLSFVERLFWLLVLLFFVFTLKTGLKKEEEKFSMLKNKKGARSCRLFIFQ